jgi:phosphatidylserine decarboxylase
MVVCKVMGALSRNKMTVLRVIALIDRLAVLPQYLLPKLALTRFAGWVATRRWGAVSHWMIRDFIRRYGVNMQEAERPHASDYACFNEFFSRALKPGARPVSGVPFVCPVDGAISQLGRIEGDQIFQAKGHRYSTQALVGMRFWRVSLSTVISRPFI